MLPTRSDEEALVHDWLTCTKSGWGLAGNAMLEKTTCSQSVLSFAECSNQLSKETIQQKSDE
jgi:hypothetical protein